MPDPSSPKPSEPVPPSSRSRRRGLIAALVLLAIVALTYGAAAFVLSRVLDPERLADWIEPRAGAAINRDVAIGSVRIGLFPVSVNLREVRVTDPTGLAPELAAVEEARLKVRILPLLKRRVEVGQLRLSSLRLFLRAGEDGSTNYGDLSPQDREGPADQAAAPVGLDLQEVLLVDAALSYQAVGARSSELNELQLTAAVSGGPEGWRLEGEGEGRLSAAGPGVPELSDADVATRFHVVASEGFEGVEITEAVLGLGEAQVAVTGRIEQLKDPVRTLDLTVGAQNLRLAQLLAALPDSTREVLPGPADAGLDVDVRIAGALGPERRPDVSGRVGVTEGRLESSDGDVLADGFSGTLEIRGDSLVVDGMTGVLLDGPFSVDGAIGPGDPRSYALTVAADMDLARLAQLSPPVEGRSVAGRASARLRVTGTADQPQASSLDGTAEVEAVTVQHPALGVPLGIPSGTLRFDGHVVRVTDLPVTLGQDRFDVTGSLRDWTAALDTTRVPEFEATVEGDHLDLARIRPEERPDTALTYGRIAFARVGGISVAGQSPESAARDLGLTRPDSLPLTGVVRLRIGVVEDPRYRLENVESRVELSDNLVRVSETRMSAFGGAISAAVDLAVGPEKDEQPFVLTLSARDVAAPELLGFTTPLGPFVDGTLGLELQFAGTLDRLLLPGPRTLEGIGRLALTGGGFQPTPLFRELARLSGFSELSAPRVREWDTPFALRDGAVVLSETPLRAASTELLVGGSMGLGGALDLTVAMDIPVDRINPDALASAGLAQDVLQRIQGRSEPVRSTFRIGGTITSPSFAVDAGSTSRAVTEAVQEEAEAQAQSELDRQRKALENRARGLFRGLLGGGDTAGTARPDTVRPDTVPRDTLQGEQPSAVDSTRRDTVPRPDTTAAGSTDRSGTANPGHVSQSTR